jgi:hypothetical protein
MKVPPAMHTKSKNPHCVACQISQQWQTGLLFLLNMKRVSYEHFELCLLCAVNHNNVQ